MRDVRPLHSSEVLGSPIRRIRQELRTRGDSQVIGHHVVEAYRRLYNGQESGEKAVLCLSSGVFVTETIVAPHGSGAVGLYVYSPVEWGELLREAEHEFELASFWAPTPSPT